VSFLYRQRDRVAGGDRQSRDESAGGSRHRQPEVQVIRGALFTGESLMPTLN